MVMSLLPLWMGIVALLLGVSVYAAHQLTSLPYAPECPACRGVTTQRVRTSRMDRLLARCGGADVRHCPRCGWHGRMRWRLAAERARRE
jgi:hypothetical protein